MINKNIFKEKKAKIFSLFLVFITLIVSGFVFYAFITQNTKNIPKFSISGELSEFNTQQDSFRDYSIHSAKSFTLEAFYDIISNFKFAGASCKIEGDYIEFCSVASRLDIENNFNTYFLANFKDSIKKYPFSEFNDVDYTLEIKDVYLNFNSAKKGRELNAVDFTAKTSFDPSFSLDTRNIYSGIILLDFQEVYNKASECKTKSSESEIKNCINIKGYETEIRINGGKVYFDLKAPYLIFKNINGVFKEEKLIMKFYMSK